MIHDLASSCSACLLVFLAVQEDSTVLQNAFLRNP